MVFVSKYLAFKKVLKPSFYTYDNKGERVYNAGISVQFQDGRLEIEDKKIIDLLLKDRVYGIDYWAVDEEGVKIEAGSEAKRIMKQDRDDVDTLSTSCPKCSFKAENEVELKEHIEEKHKTAK